MARERKSMMRYICDHCEVQVVLETPLEDYRFSDDDPHPPGWYRFEAWIRGEGQTRAAESAVADLCPTCGPPVMAAIEKRVIHADTPS